MHPLIFDETDRERTETKLATELQCNTPLASSDLTLQCLKCGVPYQEVRFSEEVETHFSFNGICVVGSISGLTNLADLYSKHGKVAKLKGGDGLVTTRPHSTHFRALSRPLAVLFLATTDATR